MNFKGTAFIPNLLIFFIFVLLASSCSTADRQTNSLDYPIQPVLFTQVKLTDTFWAPRIKTNQEVTIPIAFEQSEKTGRIKNFKIAGGLEAGQFCSIYPFDDSDVYKIIEGASYSLQTYPDPELEAYLDEVIGYIALAQEDDGYLFTNLTIMGDNSHEWVGKRWEKTHILSHELYNLGHLYEAAVAHYQATGKRNLLDVAIKSANLVNRDFGWGKFESYPGHQEIEIGLVKLFRATGNSAYLDLAKFFLDVRGPNGEEYSQSHQKVVDQRRAVGHSVRAAYMYSGMADVAAITGDPAYIEALGYIWQDIVFTKYYVTGGIGAASGNEGFGEPYHLPNDTAYCETCASIANVFWNHRMFLHKGDVRYFDVLERTLYNALLSGLGLSGDRFFYPNPLESDGRHERQEWFGCACCPSNVSRFIPSVPGYIYAQSKDRIFVNLYVDSNASIQLSGQDLEIKQKTRYPWDGKVEITLNPEALQEFDLSLRIPGWARGEAVPGDLYRFLDPSEESVSVLVNGKEVDSETRNGYFSIKREWSPGDEVVLDLPMPVRKLISDDRVTADQGRIAFQRGPLVYCAEWPDNPGGQVRTLSVDAGAEYVSSFQDDLLNGVQVITGKAWGSESSRDSERDLVLIPYHLWAHRGKGEMTVWLQSE